MVKGSWFCEWEKKTCGKEGEGSNTSVTAQGCFSVPILRERGERLERVKWG
jgi:hypothetical protein